MVCIYICGRITHSPNPKQFGTSKLKLGNELYSIMMVKNTFFGRGKL